MVARAGAGRFRGHGHGSITRRMRSFPPERDVLPPLDGLRGIGALLVFAFHLVCSVPYYGLTVPSGILRVSTGLAVLSIDAFFAASGFILFGSLERIGREAEARDARMTLEFYLRRFFRIVPLWWLVLTIELFRQHLSPGVYLANATFLFGFLAFDARYLPILVAWTLFVEMTFYALLPGLFRWIRGVLPAFLFLALTVVLARLWHHHAATLGVPSGNHFIDDFPLACFKYFALGILVRFVYRRLPAAGSPWLDAGAAVGVAIATLALRFATPAVFLLMLAVLAPGSRLARGISVKPLVFVGVHCYFVYLTHNQLFLEPMLDLVLRVAPRSPLTGWAGPGPALVAFALALAACLAAARLSMKVFEEPMIGLGKRLGARLRGVERPDGSVARGEVDRAA